MGCVGLAWGCVRIGVSSLWVAPYTGAGPGKDDQRLLKISNGRIIDQLTLVGSYGGTALCMFRMSVHDHVGYQRVPKLDLGVEDFQVIAWVCGDVTAWLLSASPRCLSGIWCNASQGRMGVPRASRPPGL